MGKLDLDSEIQVVNQLKLGNNFAFELIFHRTKGKLKGFLNKVLPVDEDVESVLQEIYLKLWLTRKSIDPKSNLEAFLFTIARNHVIDVMRKRLVKQKYLEDLWVKVKEGQDNTWDTMDRIEYSELEKRIIDIIEKLPEKRRRIFKLNRFKALTYKEISLQLNISENTVDTQMRKALEFLRKELKHYLTFLIWIYLNN